MPIATNIAGILLKNDLREVKGKIEEVWCIRQIDDDIVAEGDNDNDYGPLASKSSRVFKIKIVDNDDNIYVFFYDTWADHCKFLIENDSISLTSSFQIIHKNILKSLSNNEHKYVIAIAPSLASTDINKIILKMYSSKLLHDQFTLTSETLAQVKIELKKKRTLTETDKNVLLSTATSLVALSSSSSSAALIKKTTGDTIDNNDINNSNNNGALNESRESLKPIGPVLKKVKAGTYVYTKIADLKIPNRGEMYKNTVNVVGIVVFYGRPKLCKNGKNKYTCSYTIIDSTSKSISDGIVVNIFENSINFFPKIIAIGDVLRIHRVGVDSYQSKIQLIGNPPAHTSLATFRPKMSLLTGLIPMHNEEIEKNETNKNKKSNTREVQKLLKNCFTDIEVKANSTTRSGKNFEIKNIEDLLIEEEEEENEEQLLIKALENNSKNEYNRNNLLYNNWECNSGTEYNASYESSENENNANEFYSCLRILMRDQLGADPEILPLNLDAIYLQWYSQLIHQQRMNCFTIGFQPHPVSCTTTSPALLSSITKIQQLYTGNNRDLSSQPLITSFDLICMVVSVTKTMSENREENTIYEVWDGSLGGELYKIISDSDHRLNLTSAAQGIIRERSKARDCVHISNNKFRAISTSLHAATVYIDCQDELSLERLRSRVLNENNIHKKSFINSGTVCLTFCNSNMHSHVPQLEPGTWIRIRNAYFPQICLTNPEKPAMVGLIKADTNINVIYPFCADVTSLMNSIQVSIIANRIIINNNNNNNNTSAIEITNEVLNQSDNMQVLTKEKEIINKAQGRLMFSTAGHPFTFLALVLSTPSPAKFCTLAKVVDYWPKNIAKFVRATSTNNVTKPQITASSMLTEVMKKEYVFMFSLRLSDDTGESDVILFDKDASHFLGNTTIDRFQKNVKVRNAIEKRLQELVNEPNMYEFFLKSYTVTNPNNDSKINKKLQIYGTNIMKDILVNVMN